MPTHLFRAESCGTVLFNSPIPIICHSFYLHPQYGDLAHIWTWNSVTTVNFITLFFLQFLALILDKDFILRLVMFLCRNSSDVLHYVILFFQKATNLQIKSHIKLHHQMRLLLWPLLKILGSSSIGILYFLVGFNSSYLQNDYISCYFFHNCTVVWLFLSMCKLIGFISPFHNLKLSNIVYL